MTNETTASQPTDFRKVLVAVRESLQFANDTPNGGINDTLWMMHSSAPETVFDFIDAALDGASSMSQQTPDLFASQPKSIGDDAQFRNLLFAYLNVGTTRQQHDVYSKIIAHIDSRAPAAQASATIQAGWQAIETAPEVKGEYFFCLIAWGPEGDQNCGEGMRWKGRWFAAPVFHAIGQDRKYAMREVEVKPTHWMPSPSVPDAATIQEPVMVAEPVGVLPILDMWVDPKTKLRSILDHGTLLSPSDRREFVGSLVWSTDPQDAPLDPENLSLRPAPPTVAEPVGRDGRMSDELRKMIEGMSVSVDVSTGDDDAGNRYFGTVNEVMDGYHGEKHGVMLLIQDPEPNFDLAATVKAVPSEALDPSEVQTIAERIRNSNFAAPLADKTDGGE